MQTVRAALLDMPILPSSLKQALKSIDDWSKTLPIPGVSQQAEEITLDGAPGFFVQG